ncbi:MAG: SprT family zinc-dependent metalloprotease [Pseudomonadota bacterium]
MIPKLWRRDQDPEPAKDGQVIALAWPAVAVRLRVLNRARRFTLRLALSGSEAVLTLPPGVPLPEVDGFLQRQRSWLARAVERNGPIQTMEPGGVIPVGGQPLTISCASGRRGPPSIQGNRLVLAGPGQIGPRIGAWLRERARAQLVPAAERYAARLGRRVAGVSLRDTRSRWGSCSSQGRLSFSWRLAMAPPAVADYVAAHEAAHLVEMNHSTAFWDLVETLYPDHRAQRDWLRREGRSLHRYTFEVPDRGA